MYEKLTLAADVGAGVAAAAEAPVEAPAAGDAGAVVGDGLDVQPAIATTARPTRARR
jgi:hypothetical protein